MAAPTPPPAGAPGGPPGGSSPAQAASQAAKALVDWQDQLTAAYYAASILALLAIFSISHLIDQFLQSHRSKTSSGIAKLFVNISRYVLSSGFRFRKGLTKRGKKNNKKHPPAQTPRLPKCRTRPRLLHLHRHKHHPRLLLSPWKSPPQPRQANGLDHRLQPNPLRLPGPQKYPPRLPNRLFLRAPTNPPPISRLHNHLLHVSPLHDLPHHYLPTQPPHPDNDAAIPDHGCCRWCFVAFDHTKLLFA
jgi:hypothetical protein